MGTSNQENIAISIQTTADTSGVETARAALDSAKPSVDQWRAAMEKTNGDYIEAAKLIRDVAQQETVLAQATEAVTAAAQAETAAVGQSVQADEKKIRAMALLEIAAYKEADARVAATERETQAMARLEAAAYAEAAAREAASARANAALRNTQRATVAAGEQFEQLSPKIRSASNAAVLLSQAALTGQGSMTGLSIAAGNVAQGISALAGTARVAAAASGIGAIVSVLGVVIAAFEHFQKTVDDTKKKFTEAIDTMVNAGDVAQLKKRAQDLWLGTPAKAFEDGVVGLRKKLNDAKSDMDRASASWDFKGFTTAKQRVADLTTQLEHAEAQFKQLSAAILNPNNSPRTFDGMLGVTSTATAPSDGRAEMEKQAKLTADSMNRITESLKDTEPQWTLNRDNYERNAAALKELNAVAGQVPEIAARNVKAVTESAEASARAEESSAKRRIAAQTAVIVATGNAVGAAIAAHESAAKILTRLALAPIVAELEALSRSLAVKAAAAFVSGNVAGGAGYTAASIAASAAAGAIGASGGLGSSGSPTGSYGGGYGGSALAPIATEKGETNVTIQFVAQRTGEVINEISYRLQRNQTLDKPIYVPALAGGLS